MATDILFSMLLSLKVALLATGIIAVLGTGAAYLLARYEFRGKDLVDALTTLPLVLPPSVTGYYLIVLLGRRGVIGGPIYELTGFSLMFTWGAAVVAAVVVAIPIMIKIGRAAIEAVDPDLEMVSYTLGRSRTYTLFSITLPLARKGLMAGIILSFARALGEFGATLMVAGNIPESTDTMPLAIYGAMISGDMGTANLLAGILTFVSFLIIYLTFKTGRWLDGN
ncbi:MAG: molybdate ABC transporter permease subunit [Methanosarcinales archaeon]|nr:molybdate ABC transporter permease subunit [Methanosarcinales archaeon]